MFNHWLSKYYTTTAFNWETLPNQVSKNYVTQEKEDSKYHWDLDLLGYFSQYGSQLQILQIVKDEPSP